MGLPDLLLGADQVVDGVVVFFPHYLQRFKFGLGEIDIGLDIVSAEVVLQNGVDNRISISALEGHETEKKGV